MVKVVYELNSDNGAAQNFRLCKINYQLNGNEKSIGTDKIPDDISEYHEQRYLDYLERQKTNQDARKYLLVNDWKITRHIRHEKLVELGELEQPALTDQEYKDLLIECQRQADLVNE